MGGNPEAPAPAGTNAWVVRRIPVFVLALVALSAMPSLLWLALQPFDWANSETSDVLPFATLALAVALLVPLVTVYAWAHGETLWLRDAGDPIESAPDDLPNVPLSAKWWLVGYLVLASLFGVGVDAAGLNQPPGEIDSSDAHAAAFARLLAATTPPDDVVDDSIDLDDDRALRAWCREILPTVRSLAGDDFLHPADAELSDLSAAWLDAEERHLSQCVEGIFTLQTARLPQQLERQIQAHDQ